MFPNECCPTRQACSCMDDSDVWQHCNSRACDCGSFNVYWARGCPPGIPVVHKHYLCDDCGREWWEE
jgi:hypothetical protein